MKKILSHLVGYLAHHIFRWSRNLNFVVFRYEHAFGHQAWNPEYIFRRHLVEHGQCPKLIGCQRSSFIPNKALFEHHKRSGITVFPTHSVITKLFRLASRYQSSVSSVRGWAGLGGVGVVSVTMDELHTTMEVEQKNVAFPLSSELREKANIKFYSPTLKGEIFVCFQDRETSYKTVVGEQKGDPYDTDSFEATLDQLRNTSLKTFYKAAELLNEMNIRLVRLGAHAGRCAESPLIIDFAWKREESTDDIADLALMGNCKYFVGPNSGLWLLAKAMKKPVCLVNVFPWPWINVPMCCDSIVLPKNIWLISEKRFLNIFEMAKMEKEFYWKQFYDPTFFQRLGIEVVENSEDQIADAILEMNARLDGCWHGSDNSVSNILDEANVAHQSKSFVATSFFNRK